MYILTRLKQTHLISKCFLRPLGLPGFICHWRSSLLLSESTSLFIATVPCLNQLLPEFKGIYVNSWIQNHLGMLPVWVLFGQNGDLLPLPLKAEGAACPSPESTCPGSQSHELVEQPVGTSVLKCIIEYYHSCTRCHFFKLKSPCLYSVWLYLVFINFQLLCFSSISFQHFKCSCSQCSVKLNVNRWWLMLHWCNLSLYDARCAFFDSKI